MSLGDFCSQINGCKCHNEANIEKTKNLPTKKEIKLREIMNSNKKIFNNKIKK